MVEQQNPKEAGGLGSRTFYGGFALILIILALETALFLSKEGDLDKAEWVVLYVGVPQGAPAWPPCVRAT